MVMSNVTADMFRARYADVFLGDERWQGDQGRRRCDL